MRPNRTTAAPSCWPPASFRLHLLEDRLVGLPGGPPTLYFKRISFFLSTSSLLHFRIYAEQSGMPGCGCNVSRSMPHFTTFSRNGDFMFMRAKGTFLSQPLPLRVHPEYEGCLGSSHPRAVKNRGTYGQMFFWTAVVISAGHREFKCAVYDIIGRLQKSFDTFLNL